MSQSEITETLTSNPTQPPAMRDLLQFPVAVQQLCRDIKADLEPILMQTKDEKVVRDLEQYIMFLMKLEERARTATNGLLSKPRTASVINQESIEAQDKAAALESMVEVLVDRRLAEGDKRRRSGRRRK